MSNSADTYLLDIAKTGVSLEVFKSSEVGQYMWNRAEQVERNAELAFRDVNPEDAEAVRELQNQLKLADMFRGFLEEGIDAGNVAIAELEDEERGE